jgi:RNA-directed DNA polymerase
MNGHGKSDRFVVPANSLNKAAAAEAGEGRERAKGNTDGETRPGRSAGPGVSSELDRVREVAVRDKEARFTALLHHVSLERLRWAYWALSPKAAPGVDGVTWAAYGQDLEANLRDLHERVQQGRYRASPSRRVYIPKADGRLRPLGIATVTSYCSSCSRVSECSGLVLVRSCCRICWHEHGRGARHFRGGLGGGGAWYAGLRG